MTASKHRGPVCKECKSEFYYDFIPYPPGFEQSGLCEDCWRATRRHAKRVQDYLDWVKAKMGDLEELL